MLSNNSHRPSGLNRVRNFSWQDVNLDYFMLEYEELQSSYSEIKKKYAEARKPYAYAVSFKGLPDILYITFQDMKGVTERRPSVVSSAILYYRDEIMHPAFVLNDGWKELFLRCTRTARQPHLDKYAEKGRIPIPEYFKIGGKVPCSVCGKHLFDLDNYQAKKCYIIEGEGDNIIPFLKGYCLCYDCYKKWYCE